jgi:ABC-type antimicrobial peptide transport system permease subunit
LLAKTVQQSLQGVATQEAPDNFRTMEDVLSASIAQQRFNMLLLSLFAALALALGGVGLYGVLSYLVAQRTHEMGIRMALGASRREVLRLIVRNGLRMTFIGLGIGIVAAVGLTRLLAGLLFGVKPTDPLTFGTVSLVQLRFFARNSVIHIKKERGDGGLFVGGYEQRESKYHRTVP